jgi:hypothetical protein
MPILEASCLNSLEFVPFHAFEGTAGDHQLGQAVVGSIR